MRLIILNGSPGAGKSTAAAKLHADLPLSLLADLDSWRKLVSGWRENREESLKYTYTYAIAAIDAYLGTGKSVIVDKAIRGEEVIDALVAAGKKHDAEVFEFILTATQEVVSKRAEERGFHTHGLLTPEKVVELWQAAQELIAKRLQAIVIDTSAFSPEEVYEKIKRIVFL
jgi:predicted kinase